MGLRKIFGPAGAQLTSAGDSGANGDNVPLSTADEFRGLVRQSAVPVVVDFWAEWCSPCHMISPSVHKLKEAYEGRALVIKLNADDYPEILEAYGVMGIPTLIFFDKGEEYERAIGLVGYDVLKRKLEKAFS